MSVFIIAEAGVNHNGSISLAKKLIDIASESGANAVKFQTFKSDKLVTKRTKKAKYQTESSNSSETQFEMLRGLELGINAHKQLIKYCQHKKILFMSSPFDHESINLLNSLGLHIFKIPSGEITNLPYLRHIGSLDKKIILSTGMSTLKEIEDSINILVSSGTDLNNIQILHANTMYPTPMEDVNLNAMIKIQKKFGVNVGYSDHTLGNEVAIAAVALGASVIEKHFTLDKSLPGPDHKASLNPNELKQMIESIRNIELALGDGVKSPSPSESINMPLVRKSIVANIEIKKGDILTTENITIKRPGTGISPMKYDDLLGTVANKNYKKDDLI